MLQAIREEDYTSAATIDHITLPDSLRQLLIHYENEDSPFVRICILSKMKQMIIREVHFKPAKVLQELSFQQSSFEAEEVYSIERQIFFEDPKNSNTVISNFFLKFLKRGNRQGAIPKNQLHLLYHVVSLVIKYFYNEQHFKFLFNEITEQIQNHKQRVQMAIEFFIEVVSTIEFNYQEVLGRQSQNFGAKINHCRFQRHFTTSHLNSMLAVANFFMKKAFLKDNQNFEDGLFIQDFKKKASEEHILSILQLLHKVLCFDFIGEKYSNENEDSSLSTNIIIPTKSTKHSNLSQFEKWLKNSDWIRVYQFIYQQCSMIAIKLIIIQILGDMARIHMKYFKNKGCYKVHIENVVYALADILEQSVINYSKQDLLTISIGFGRNILKLTSPAIVPIFFEINSNIYGGLLESVKTFLVDHIIIEEVFNVNIIYYFFKFIHNLHVRCKFQKTTVALDFLERVTRQICRNYENYLRILMKKMFKSPTSQKIREFIHLRQDYLHLRQTFDSYNSEEIMIYLSPFKFMKPRYTSINTVEELFVMVCAKVTRSLYIFEIFPNSIRQREFAIQMIEKSIMQTIQWFSYTTYFKKNSQYADQQEGEQKKSGYSNNMEGNSYQLTMESINQEYQQQIQNEYEYCHVLRLICFYITDSIDKIPEKVFKHLNNNSEIFKLINLLLDLCFRADLQQKQNTWHLNSTVKVVIQEQLQCCVRILERLYLNQWQHQLYSINKEKNTSNTSYRYQCFESQYQFIDIGEFRDQMMLLQTINLISLPFISQNQFTIQSLKQIQILLAYSVARLDKSSVQNYSKIEKLEDCQCFLLLLFRNQALLQLLYVGQPVIVTHFEALLRQVRQYQLKSNFISQINRYLQALNFLVNIKYEQISQQMTNRLFVFLYEITSMLQSPSQSININQQFIDCLQKIDQQCLRKKKDLSFQQLHSKIQYIVNQFQTLNQKSK